MDDKDCAERQETTLRSARRPKNFASAELEDRYWTLVESAQSSFLEGKPEQALRSASDALRILPSAFLFSLLAAIHDSRGNFVKASDCRLLQAFMAQDKVLWEELLDEFAANRQFYKMTVCLQRLGSLCPPDSPQRRSFLLQRAELYVVLGETSRAKTVYEGLWKRSNGTDFEVFAMLASLYFQWGRLQQLENIVVAALGKVQRAPAEATVSLWEKNYLTLLNVYCELEIEKGEYSRAIAAIRDAAHRLKVKVEDLHPDIVVRYGVGHAFLGRIDVASQIFCTLTLRCSVKEFGDVMYDAAETLSAIGSWDLALSLYKHLLNDEDVRSHSGSAAAIKYALGRCYLALGDIAEATNSFSEVLRINPGHVRTRIALAHISLELGDLDEAARLLYSRGDEAPLDRIVLDNELVFLYSKREMYLEALQTGLPIVEMFLDGDSADSLASGETRHRRTVTLIPRAVRTSSVIVPSASVAEALPDVQSTFSRVPMETSSLLPRLIATSFATQTAPSAVVSLRLRGAIASTVAASTSARTMRREGARELHDKNAIFRFRRARRSIEAGASTSHSHRVRDFTAKETTTLRAQAQWMSQAVVEDSQFQGVFDDFADESSFSRQPIQQMEEASYDLPPLDQLAAELDDPVLASAFVSATAGLADIPPTHEQQAVPECVPKRSEVVAVLGKEGIVSLAVELCRAYGALQHYNDGKAFASTVTYAISGAWKRVPHLLATLRMATLRLSLASGEMQDAARFALELLNSEESPTEEVLSALSRASNSSCQRMAILERFIRTGKEDVSLLCIAANSHFNSRRYIHALKLYLLALAKAPDDSLINFQVGLCYLFESQSRYWAQRHRAVVHAAGYLSHYWQLSVHADRCTALEATYNLARAYHFLSLLHLALPLYQQVLNNVDSTSQKAKAIRIAAATNMGLILRASHNEGLERHADEMESFS